MTQAVSFSTCSFCGLNQKVTDAQCVGCGAGLDLPRQEEVVTNEQTLALVTQMNALMTKEAKRIRGARLFTKIRVGVALVCFVWVFAVWVFNVRSPNSIIYNGDIMSTSEAVDRAYLRLMEQHTYAEGDVQ